MPRPRGETRAPREKAEDAQKVIKAAAPSPSDADPVGAPLGGDADRQLCVGIVLVGWIFENGSWRHGGERAAIGQAVKIADGEVGQDAGGQGRSQARIGRDDEIRGIGEPAGEFGSRPLASREDERFHAATMRSAGRPCQQGGVPGQTSSVDSPPFPGISFPHDVPAQSRKAARRMALTGFSLFIPKEVRFIAEKLDQAGRKAYVVGGALRDHVMQRRVGNDFDMATDASPQEIIALFPRVLPTGIKHGTVTVLTGRHGVEITTFRLERGFSDGRRPDAVEFVADVEEDLSRRDFTMNAMALEVTTGRLHDPFGGREDIARRQIRSVGDPALRFAEDGLRPLRAIRFAAQLGFSIDADTLAAIPGAAATFRLVSQERVREELLKILLSPSPSTGLRLLESTGLLADVLPELLASRGCLQKGMHAFDVIDHLFLAADMAIDDPDIRLAALFHDAGKPAASAPGEDGEPTFYNHERISANLAGQAMRRLKFPNDTIERVVHLVQNHMFNYTDAWTDAAVRRFLARVGVESVDGLFALRLADSAAIRGTAPEPLALEPFRKRIEAILAQSAAFSIKDLDVDGADLASIGVPKGPIMGKILRELLETVLDDPAQNERETLLRIAASLKARYGVSN